MRISYWSSDVCSYDLAGHSNERVIRLSVRIVRAAGMGMSRVYYGLSGSDANETNVKLVWYLNNVLGRPEKKKNISRRRGYHGSGLMTGSLTGLALFPDAFHLPLSRVLPKLGRASLRETVCQ